MYSGRFFARTAVIRSHSTQHYGYSVTFCKDNWDSVSINTFCFLFHVLNWTLWSGVSPPSRTLHNPHTFFHFILWKRVSVSFLFFFFFFFFKPETLPPWSVPCWLYVRGFSRLNLPLEYCSVHFIQRSNSWESQAVPVCTLFRFPHVWVEALWFSPVAVHGL